MNHALASGGAFTADWAMIRPLLVGAAAPAAVALVVFGAAAWMEGHSSRVPAGPRAGDAARSGWGGAAAVALGVVSAYLVVLGWPPIPPRAAHEWLLVIAVVAGLAGIADARLRFPAAGAWGVRLVLSGASLALLLRSMWQHHWESTFEKLTWVVGLWLALVVHWSLLEWVARSSRGPATWLAITIVAIAQSVTLGLSGSLLLAQLCGGVVAAMGVGFMYSVGGRAGTLSRGATPVLSLVPAGLLVCGHFYAELDAINAVLLAAAPFTVSLALLLSRFSTRRWSWPLGFFARGAIVVLAGATPAVWAAIRAALAYAPDDPYGAYAAVP